MACASIAKAKRSPAEAERSADRVDLSYGPAQESSTAEVSFCALDSVHGGARNQEKVWNQAQ